MIRAEVMTASAPTFFDPAGYVPDEQKYYRTLGETEGGWTVVRIFDRCEMTVTEDDLKRFEAVADDVVMESDLTPLLGKFVRVNLVCLSSAKGTICAVKTGKIKIGDKTFSFPESISLDGDWHDLKSVESIELL